MRTSLLALLVGMVACGPTPTSLTPGDAVGDDDVSGDDDDVSGDDDDDCGCAPEETCVDAICVSCTTTLTWPGTAPDADVQLVQREPRDWSELSLLLRPVEISGGTLGWSGPIALYTVDGTELVSGADVTEGTYLVRGSGEGPATLSLTPPAACDSDTDATATLAVHRDRALAARLLNKAPFAERVQLFGPGDAVAIVPDAVEHADRVGITAPAVVVADRTATEWANDPAFGTPVFSGTIDLSAPDTFWSALPSGPGIVGRYDLVVDIDRDGAFSSGDLVQGFDGPAFAVAGDLSAPGPYPVIEFEWSQAFWITQKVYYPDDLGSLDPLPLVVMSHGNGHDYRWYDYLGRHLASWGYVMMSHRNDTEPGPVAASRTTLDNTDALLALLPTIEGGVLDGEIDSSRIAWIGHSRGGEGVVLAYDDLVDGVASPSTYTAADIQLVSSIAPTVFEGPQQGNPNDVKYHLLVGSSDGDVTGGPDCNLCQYFRLLKNGTAEAWVTYFQGSTHNDFHDDVNGAFDDGRLVNGVKIGSTRTQRGAKAYLLALLDHVLRGDPLTDEYLERAPELLRPEGVDFILATQARRSPTRSVVDDFQSAPDVGQSSSGSAVTGTVTGIVEGLADDGNGTLNWTGSDPFNGMTWSDNDGANAERVAAFEWEADAQLDFELVGLLTDQSRATHLSLRAAQYTRHPYTTQLDGMLSFTVGLVDASGTEVGFDLRAWGGIPKPARRTGNGNGSGWVNEFQTVRIPLEAFTADGRGLDLANLAAIRLRFGPSHGSEVGRIGLDDIEFVTEETP